MRCPVLSLLSFFFSAHLTHAQNLVEGACFRRVAGWGDSSAPNSKCTQLVRLMFAPGEVARKSRFFLHTPVFALRIDIQQLTRLLVERGWGEFEVICRSPPFLSCCCTLFCLFFCSVSNDMVIMAMTGRYDVYMGIDTFGRGTWGGGGFDVDKALGKIRRAGVSAALFAPSWTMQEETTGSGSPWELQPLLSPLARQVQRDAESRRIGRVVVVSLCHPIHGCFFFFFFLTDTPAFSNTRRGSRYCNLQRDTFFGESAVYTHVFRVFWLRGCRSCNRAFFTFSVASLLRGGTS